MDLYSEGGTIVVQGLSVTLADGSLVRTDGRNIRIEAVTGSLTVGSVDARSADDRADGTRTMPGVT
ncbi:hypothetical protein HK414_15830 [Ramlibacter terrae]|uniref:Uncharacterized protein n=1 Tax=Ramlibacter terrae TaxID=2732511 RepID=A0ABX6P3G9_9BURK|nr:hypothetical protein HK414_15830 [Ramlibacter terrae]